MVLPVARGRERHPLVTGIFILFGVVFAQIFLMLLLSSPVSNGITASSGTDPFFVLVTPSTGDRSGKLFYVMDWDDSDFEIHPTESTKTVQKVELKPEWDGEDSEFRLASPNEVKRLKVPYDHTFKTADGTTEVSVTESNGAITIRRSSGNHSRVCTYSPDNTGPNFR